MNNVKFLTYENIIRQKLQGSFNYIDFVKKFWSLLDIKFEELNKVFYHLINTSEEDLKKAFKAYIDTL